MDLKASNYLLHSLAEETDNVFSMGNKDGVGSKSSSNVEAPPTPGRPVFGFSVGSRKNSIPSKWDDAQKWLISSPDSPAAHHGFVKSPAFVSKHSTTNKQDVSLEENVSKDIPVFQVPKTTNVALNQNYQHSTQNALNRVLATDSSDVLVFKDKFTNGEEHNVTRFKCVVSIKQEFLFSSMKDASTEVIQDIIKTDSGANIKPDGSCVAQCPTPVQSVSPPGHNTPASMSGPLTLMNAGSSFDIAELQECHLAKLQLETPYDSVNACNWSSREEEEEDVSKSLRHFEMINESPKSRPEPKVCVWEEEEKTKSDSRYQREEAKIQAWVNLQNAKAEAQSRKLEVKIQKMRSKFEEKMTKRMATVHRKAEELRAAAQYEHNMQLRKATATTRSKKTKDLHESMHFSGHIGSYGCFPCSNTLHL